MDITNKPDIREQVLKKGLIYPSDQELVMLILGSGTRRMPVEMLSHRVIKALDSANTETIISQLLKINGIGNGKALAIAAAMELGRRRTNHLQAVIKHPKDLVPFIRHYSIEKKEHFLCATLNGAHEIIQIRLVSVGTVNKTLVHPREIFCEALTEHAAAIIVCHNHPSGNCEPSNEDIETTKILIQASKILGISLLDHIIINKDSYFSFLEHNLLFIT